MAKKRKLGLCPFCGSNENFCVLFREYLAGKCVSPEFECGKYFRVKCGDCGAYGPIGLNRRDAAARWAIRDNHNNRSAQEKGGA